MSPGTAIVIIVILAVLATASVVYTAVTIGRRARTSPSLPGMSSSHPCLTIGDHDWDDPGAPVSTCRRCGIVRDSRGEHTIYRLAPKG